ncbi:hypothetical protein HELRODRAFT_162732 [Helobdella robusta]|uniref:Uncharacterized protein n=1 Tax=Helobdella robusta TaxID=6412 RepID=T1ET25_HELRO|nr:hypothetical protein HELRODRAFT_162732 [Helobdella robusta]ESN99220.1 hypothetical protein HELRODRAFT_162732 [Helobdella robusta]
MYIFNQSTRYVTGVVYIGYLSCSHHLSIALQNFLEFQKILFFKRFREKWTEMNHTPEARSTPLIIVSDAIKAFIKCQLEVRHSQDDYLEFLLLAAQIVGLQFLVRLNCPELGTLALFSSLLSDKEKIDLVRTIQADRGPHLMKTLPQSFDNLRASKTFFETSNIDVFLMYLLKTDAEQKQFLLQVVEQHRKNFAEYNRELLAKI